MVQCVVNIKRGSKSFSIFFHPLNNPIKRREKKGLAHILFNSVLDLFNRESITCDRVTEFS